MRKPDFCLCENKGADQLRSNSAFVFTTRIVQFLFFLNPKFKASSLLLGLYRSFCVRPCWKPQRPVFSCHGSYQNDPYDFINTDVHYDKVSRHTSNCSLLLENSINFIVLS